jgi:hypothetical protein
VFAAGRVDAALNLARTIPVGARAEKHERSCSRAQPGLQAAPFCVASVQARWQAAGIDDPEDQMKKRFWRMPVVIMACVILAYAALLIPEPRFQAPAGAGKRPFVWNQDQLWRDLENEFIKARQEKPDVVKSRLDALLAEAGKTLEEVGATDLAPGDKVFSTLENRIFVTAPPAGASPARVPEFARLVESARDLTKKQSEHWDLKEPQARAQLYRILFGGRMALEMVMVQASGGAAVGPLSREEPSGGPAVTAAGVRLHSGDIFVSRGNTPTSSLIARGNDFPGNFSHVALLHVDEGTGRATVIESLLERGVVTVPLATFLEEKRLRLMALRLRADLPSVRTDPQLPHRAATFALKAAQHRHIPYDFAMNFADHNSQFCSEVVSSAYEEAGIRLWMGMTFISSPTVTAWLASLGVRHFETQEPSDLEYDPQLRVVAEWRNPTNLLQAHLDDAVTDSMFEAARPGAPLDYSLLKLPLARIVKVYSVGLNVLGREGPVPEGMSATTALRASRFREEHRLQKEALARAADEFHARHGYWPTYWELLKMARRKG